MSRRKSWDRMAVANWMLMCFEAHGKNCRPCENYRNPEGCIMRSCELQVYRTYKGFTGTLSRDEVKKRCHISENTLRECIHNIRTRGLR